MISSGLVPVQRSLRYTQRTSTGQPRHLVYLLHGYGQLSRYFIRKVEEVLPEAVCFVAPEGMHRFYLNGTAGRVGASWMTKEARELDIIENTASLDALHTAITENWKPERITVIGFSQGGATAARWLANGAIEADCFVSWASVFPPDIAFPEEQLAPERYFVLGNNDPYFNESDAARACAAYEQIGFEVVRFEGVHDLDTAVIEQLLQRV